MAKTGAERGPLPMVTSGSGIADVRVPELFGRASEIRLIRARNSGRILRFGMAS
jgi:hypothetical protein